jgi:hypothetical protein
MHRRQVLLPQRATSYSVPGRPGGRWDEVPSVPGTRLRGRRHAGPPPYAVRRTALAASVRGEIPMLTCGRPPTLHGVGIRQGRLGSGGRRLGWQPGRGRRVGALRGSERVAPWAARWRACGAAGAGPPARGRRAWALRRSERVAPSAARWRAYGSAGAGPPGRGRRAWALRGSERVAPWAARWRAWGSAGAGPSGRGRRAAVAGSRLGRPRASASWQPPYRADRPPGAA